MSPPQWEQEQDLFQAGALVPKTRWRPGGKPLVDPRLRQASIVAWALPSDDAQVLLDALEYSEDLDLAAEAAFDVSLLASHGAVRTAPSSLPSPAA